MVHEKADVLPKRDAAPTSSDRLELAKDVIESGEALLYVRGQSEPIEAHAYDTHFYPVQNVLYTEGRTDEDDDDLWVFADDIVMVERH